MDKWVELFRTEVVPARRFHDFQVAGMWVDIEANQFVWIASYHGQLD